MKIEVLFPEICNLYGDLANIKVIKESIDNVEIIETHLTDTPYFINNKVDMIYMGTMTENSQILVINKLREYTENIKRSIDSGINFFITGNAIEVFGNTISEDNEHVIDGLGIIDIDSNRDSRNRYNSLYVGDFNTVDETIKVVGFKSVFGFTQGKSLDNKLFHTRLGYASNLNTKNEGVWINNFMATYVIGPLFVLNPPFAEWYFKNMLGVDAKPAYYDAAMDAYNARLEEYLTPGKGWKY